MLTNPANMGFTRRCLIDPVYQAQVENNTHGVGIQAMDSLLNPRVAVGLGYMATLGLPNVTFKDDRGGSHQLELFHMAHEVGLPVAVNAAPGWLALVCGPSSCSRACASSTPRATRTTPRGAARLRSRPGDDRVD